MKSWHFSLIVLASLCLIYLAIAEDDITETGNNENNEEDKALSERQKRICKWLSVYHYCWFSKENFFSELLYRGQVSKFSMCIHWQPERNMLQYWGVHFTRRIQWWNLCWRLWSLLYLWATFCQCSVTMKSVIMELIFSFIELWW